MVSLRLCSGSAIFPATARGRGRAGLIRWTVPPFPMRPMKLRLVVEAQTSPSASTPLDMPRQAPQVGLVTQKPASRKTWMMPSLSACRRRPGVAGDEDGAHVGDTFFPFDDLHRLAEILDAAVRAGADVDLVDGVPSISRMSFTWSGLKSKVTSGSRAERSILEDFYVGDVGVGRPLPVVGEGRVLVA